MSEVLIQADNLGKKFCRRLRRSLWYGALDIGSDLLGRNGTRANLRKEEFWALNEVSFALKRGECLGLIGRNGAGKTTLLKLINNLMKPDSGSLQVKGRVGALIALGAGFNPVLTGRENIYVNGAVLGLTKREVEDGMDEILDFAGIGEFIDAPVQSYSSGMGVRLGFAVATRFSPDVILLDEVLAVGDFGFQAKCLARINELKQKGAASILVSHNMTHMLQFADHCLWLEKGKKRDFGATREIAQNYVDFVNSESNRPEETKLDASETAIYGGAHSNGSVSQESVKLVDANGKTTCRVGSFDSFKLEYYFQIDRPRPLGVTFAIYKEGGTRFSYLNNLLNEFEVKAEENGEIDGVIEIDSLGFAAGSYVLVLAIQDGVEYLHRAVAAKFEVTRAKQEKDIYGAGLVAISHRWLEKNK